MLDIEVNDQQSILEVDTSRLERAVTCVLTGEGVSSASISLAVVDDEVMRKLNRRHLQHDYATDVLSFLLEDEEDGVEGEVIVSAETAVRQAPHYGWDPASELLLYVVHGVLHLLGYDDHEPHAVELMRRKEDVYLAELGCPRAQMRG